MVHLPLSMSASPGAGLRKPGGADAHSHRVRSRAHKVRVETMF